MRVLVTGGSKGIGKAIVDTLRKEGHEVDSWSRTEGYDLLKYNYDIENIDILINNVGGGGTWSDETEQMDINYLTMVDLINQFVNQKKKWGRVITISSIYGKEKGHNPGFTASKAAQIAYMKTMAGKYKGITFNTICPGHIDVGKKFPDPVISCGKPEDVANLVSFLCSDKADHINGATITCDGGESHSF